LPTEFFVYVFPNFPSGLDILTACILKSTWGSDAEKLTDESYLQG